MTTLDVDSIRSYNNVHSPYLSEDWSVTVRNLGVVTTNSAATLKYSTSGTIGGDV